MALSNPSSVGKRITLVDFPSMDLPNAKRRQIGLNSKLYSISPPNNPPVRICAGAVGTSVVLR